MQNLQGELENLSRSQLRRRQDILCASLEIFERDGFEAARMADIAEAAGVAKGTIYLYFENKVALLEGVIQSSIIPTLKELGETAELPDGSAEEILSSQMQITVQRMASPQMRTLLRHMISGGPKQQGRLIRFYFANVVQPAIELIGQTLKNGVESGEFREEAGKIDPLVLVGAQIYTTVWKILFEEIAPIDETSLSADLTEISLRGLLKT